MHLYASPLSHRHTHIQHFPTIINTQLQCLRHSAPETKTLASTTLSEYCSAPTAAGWSCIALSCVAASWLYSAKLLIADTTCVASAMNVGRPLVLDSWRSSMLAKRPAEVRVSTATKMAQGPSGSEGAWRPGGRARGVVWLRRGLEGSGRLSA